MSRPLYRNVHNQRVRPVSHPSLVRPSHSGAGAGGVGVGAGAGAGGGGGGLVGPMFTSKTSTCSSPVVTLPPVLPPVLTLPEVELVMPPDGCVGIGIGVGAGEGTGLGVGVGSIVRPEPLSRAEGSRTSAYALKANTDTARKISAARTVPAIEVVFVILLIFLLYDLPETDTHNIDVDHIEGGCI